MLNGGYAAGRCERTFIGSFVRRSFWKARLSRRARALRKFPSYRQYRRWNERPLCKFEGSNRGERGNTGLASSWSVRSCIARRKVKICAGRFRNSQREAPNRKHECRFSRGKAEPSFLHRDYYIDYSRERLLRSSVESDCLTSSVSANFHAELNYRQ
jgi:hypothetical protein